MMGIDTDGMAEPDLSLAEWWAAIAYLARQSSIHQSRPKACNETATARGASRAMNGRAAAASTVVKFFSGRPASLPDELTC